VPASAAPDSAPAAPSAATSNATSDSEQAQAEIALAPAIERPADAKSVTTSHSQAHANQLLEKAIDSVFAVGVDARMMAAMPTYWKLYYQPAAWPPDPSVLKQSAVDKKARLVSVIDPTSNQYAQDHGVAGMAEYHVVVAADGKLSDIAIARPIGFGLDEIAVQSLHQAAFEPAMKDGHPVPVTLDMVVEFRIYSKLTAEATKPHAVPAPEHPTLPGPYSVQH
jgi:TonB family protein